MSGQESPQTEATPLKVLEHFHDETAGVYTIVTGREVFVAEHLVEVPVLDEEGQAQYDEVPSDDDPDQLVQQLRTTAETVPRTVLGVMDVQDYVFADDDDRWFDANGDRRPDTDVAAEQRQDIKAALDEAATRAAVEVEPPRELPGVGDEL